MTGTRRSARGLTELVRRPGRRLRNLRALLREAKSLGQRVADLELEVQENRQLNRRIAELTDVVQELLLPAEQRDEEKLRSRLDRYEAGQ